MPLLGTATCRFPEADYSGSEGGGKRPKGPPTNSIRTRMEAKALERETGLAAPSGTYSGVEVQYRLER